MYIEYADLEAESGSFTSNLHLLMIYSLHPGLVGSLASREFKKEVLNTVFKVQRLRESETRIKSYLEISIIREPRVEPHTD